MNGFTVPMPRWTRMALASLSLLVLSLSVFGQTQGEKPSQDSQEQSIKIPTGLVTVPVIVTDHYGRFITGLESSQFTVLEEGSIQKIDQFSTTEAPFNVALLIDTSHSTQNKLGRIRKAAETFIKQLLPNDRIMVVSFDDKVRFVCDFTGDQNQLKNAVKSLESRYATSLYDAIYQTINEKMNKVQGRKAIVVLTDGVDTASKNATFESAIELAASAGVITYTVQYETRNDGGPMMNPRNFPGVGNSFTSGAMTWQDEGQATKQSPGASPSSRINSQRREQVRDPYLIAADFLRTIAVQSGGQPFKAETIENTTRAFQLIANELHNQYTLTYVSTNEKHDGAYRSISVRINNHDLIVRSRRFYRSPTDETPADKTDDKKPVPKQQE